MDKKIFVLSGYLVGLGGLALLTYRTLLAVGSDSKAIVVSVNRFGEQYVDLAALAVLWIVCIVGMWSLFRLSKEQKKESVVEERGSVVTSFGSVRDSFMDGAVGAFPGVSAESDPADAQGYAPVDEGVLSDGSSVSVTVVWESVSEEP